MFKDCLAVFCGSIPRNGTDQTIPFNEIVGKNYGIRLVAIQVLESGVAAGTIKGRENDNFHTSYLI